jgi:hypothetical protein
MIRDMRDLAIFLLTMYVLVVAISARVSPEGVGHWKARMEVSYDSVWSEYLADCDCTDEY